ncbi:methionine--tRNA ligase, mitochondrial-like [Mya arenaria]|uniref:methionine--tRNA ligase, mitochondrial-like n=1 Tax=Mya arenaria TaxID=6604 RepID=UPI0022E4AF40|nr:methionine--tRNA ligase, mitochondrial-like [Mya arenaria]
MHLRFITTCFGCCQTRLSFLNIQRPLLEAVQVASTGSRQLCLSSVERKPFFVTTPIYYVNAAPHMGHLYSSVIADATARYQRLKGADVMFSTGTDEHGLKIQQAATQTKTSPDLFVSKVSQSFKTMFDGYHIGYTDYIRTTEERHHRTVTHVWNELVRRGHIYKGDYEGWYCVSDEAFLGADDVVDRTDKHGNTIKVSVESGHQVTWMKEDNYMFSLSRFKDQLHAWLDKDVIQPQMFDSNVRRWVDDLRDLSVSRSKSRLTWGIPVPGDNTQTIYVWLDALLNYLTVTGYPDTAVFPWPPDVQVIGKDILKFHAVYWPAFLTALGLELPKKIFCHSHWMVDGVKMSKSLGNVVDPMALKDKYSAEVLRYYLLREGVPQNDGNFNEKVAIEYVNSDVVNTMGNLLSRCTGTSLNPDQIFPRRNTDVYQSRFNTAERETFENLEMLTETVDNYYKELNFYKGIESVMSYLRWANSVVTVHEPWKLAKSQEEGDKAYVKTVIHIALETLRVGGILLQPVIPDIAARLLNRLGIPAELRTLEHAKKPYLNSPEHFPLGPNEGALLRRLNVPTK